jgi:hypothetical protein
MLISIKRGGAQKKTKPRVAVQVCLRLQANADLLHLLQKGGGFLTREDLAERGDAQESIRSKKVCR